MNKKVRAGIKKENGKCKCTKFLTGKFLEARFTLSADTSKAPLLK